VEAFGLENRIKSWAKRTIIIMDQEPQGLFSVGKFPNQLPGLLRNPDRNSLRVRCLVEKGCSAQHWPARVRKHLGTSDVFDGRPSDVKPNQTIGVSIKINESIQSLNR